MAQATPGSEDRDCYRGGKCPHAATYYPRTWYPRSTCDRGSCDEELTGGKRTTRRSMNRLRALLVYPIVFVLSFVLVVASLLLPVTIRSRADLEQVKFGWPLAFIVQDQSRWPIGVPEGPSLPYRTRPLSPWETPTSVYAYAFLFDISSVFVLMLLVQRLVRTKRR